MNKVAQDVYEITVATSDAAVGESETAASLIAGELEEMKTGFAVCWLWDAILFGRIVDGFLAFPGGKTPDYERDLREMRLFNKDRELYLYRKGKGFGFRRRIDGIGKGAEYIEVKQVLWGTRGDVEAGWTTLSEERGIRLTVPIEAQGVTEQRRVALVTRNYITDSEIGQAGITDCRFVDLVCGGE